MARFVPTLSRRLVLSAVALVVIAGIGYLAVTALLARRELTNAKSALSVVKSRLLAGDEAGARAELVTADADADAAARRTSGVAWRVAAAVPWLGAPLDTVRGIALTAHDLTSTTLPQVVGVASSLSPDRLRIASNQVDVRRLRTAAPTLADVERETAAATKRADDLPHGTWLPAADKARQQFADLIGGLHSTVAHASPAATAPRAAKRLPAMRGADGPRRYLLVIQTNAESRGLGGLPGVFAVVRAH